MVSKMNDVNQLVSIVMSIKNAIDRVKHNRLDQFTDEGFSVVVYCDELENYTADVAFYEDPEMTIWYYKPEPLDTKTVEIIDRLLLNDDTATSELLDIAWAFINNDWIKEIELN